MAGLFGNNFGDWFTQPIDPQGSMPTITRSQVFGNALQRLGSNLRAMSSGGQPAPVPTLQQMAAEEERARYMRALQQKALQPTKPTSPWVGGASKGRLYRYNKQTGQTEWLDPAAGGGGDAFVPMTAEEAEATLGFVPSATQLASLNASLKAGDEEKTAKLIENWATRRQSSTESASKQFKKDTAYYDKVIAGGRRAAQRFNKPVLTGVDGLETLYSYIRAIAQDDSAVREGELQLAEGAQSILDKFQVQIDRAIQNKDVTLANRLVRTMDKEIMALATEAQRKRREELDRYTGAYGTAIGADTSVIGKRRPDLAPVPEVGKTYQLDDGSYYTLGPDYNWIPRTPKNTGVTASGNTTVATKGQ